MYLLLCMCINCLICVLVALYVYLLLYTFINIFIALLMYCFVRAFVYSCIYAWVYLCIYGNPQMCIYGFVLLCQSIANNRYFFIIIYLTSDLTDLTDFGCAYQYLTILSILRLSSPKLTRNPNFIFVALR